jgi:hypothetical protein
MISLSLHLPFPSIRQCSNGSLLSPTPRGKVVFQHDPNGDLLELALELHAAEPTPVPETLRPPKDSSLVKEDDFDEAEFTKTFFVEPKANRLLRKQKELMEEYITGIGDPDDDAFQPPRATETDRRPLELYSQLTDDEFLYVQ